MDTNLNPPSPGSESELEYEPISLDSDYEDINEVEEDVEETIRAIFGSDDEIEEPEQENLPDLPPGFQQEFDGSKVVWDNNLSKVKVDEFVENSGVHQNYRSTG